MNGSIEIENAGLALTAPFLPFFFRSLGWLDVMRFTNEETHARALFLLQYMVNGETTDAGGSMALNALLCGWPHNRPIPSSPVLGEMEKREADRLLHAIRTHWTALGEKTTDDLRRLFLRRKGTLETGINTALTVESAPQDILLRELPWIYAVTRTPWSDAIHVAWHA